MDYKPSLAAVRQRRYRERRGRGVTVIEVEVDADLLATLATLGLIESADVADPNALAFALAMLVEEAAENRRNRKPN